MSLAFSIQTSPSLAARVGIQACHALLPLSLGAFALQLSASPLVVVMATLFGVLAIWISLRHANSVMPAGRLCVLSDGRAQWTKTLTDPHLEPGSTIGQNLRRPVPLEMLAWCRIGPLVWLKARAGGVERRFLLGRDRYPDQQWRSLCAWLTWLERARGTNDQGDDLTMVSPLANSRRAPRTD